jgi:hypothetical protein
LGQKVSGVLRNRKAFISRQFRRPAKTQVDLAHWEGLLQKPLYEVAKPAFPLSPFSPVLQMPILSVEKNLASC